jgi:hypothetical protein
MYKIKINEKEWPLDFSMATLALFARENGDGLNALTSGFTMDLLGIMRFMAISVQEGCDKKKQKLPDDFSWKTVADWFEKDPELAGKFLTLYYESQGLKLTEDEGDQVGKLNA